MDQGSLVKEQIDAGAALIQEFNRYAPLQSAFWLKESEDGEWFLYLASDQIDDSNFDLAYGEVMRLTLNNPNLWLDPFSVKVIGAAHPVAQAALAVQQHFPSKRPIRSRDRQFGGLIVDEAYIYALPATAPA